MVKVTCAGACQEEYAREFLIFRLCRPPGGSGPTCGRPMRGCAGRTKRVKPWMAKIFSRIQDLHDRAAKWLADAEDEAYMRGARWEGGVRADTPRARWICALRRESRQFEAEGEQLLALYDVEDVWGLRVLFGKEAGQPDLTGEN
ncbi:uncharacterized protein LOC135168127 [Diachasmimorpha longicaudata]|uniref:uncharacterized protein LOC135168127 n=1 Tax=Diachasmimorpha longicaudata TaxID=58733 RepID=UPI0030B8B39F